MAVSDYTSLADALAADITAGRLKPGDRLPPQRRFAYEKRIAVSTAGRVYGELLRRGLVVGEVGRGTFVAGSSGVPSQWGMPHDGYIDLEFNFPTVPQQAARIARALSGLQRADVAATATGPLTSRQIDAARTVFARYFAARAWRPDAEGLVFTGSGRQAIAAALSMLVPVGGRVAAETLSFPMIKNIAQRIGVQIVPIAMDKAGLVPEELERAHRRNEISALYVQPIIHNPLGVTMPPARREEIVRVAKRLGIVIVEDVIYRFLSDVPPLAALAPEQCIVVDSLSKRLAPGVSVGVLHAPPSLRDRTWPTVRGGAWTVPPLSLALGTRMIEDGAIAELVTLKRQDARRRQAIMGKALAGFETLADPASFHLWLKLPEGWRSEAFATAAARAGVAVTTSSAFAMLPAHAPPAVRLALGLPSHDELQVAGARLAEILRRAPEEAEVAE